MSGVKVSTKKSDLEVAKFLNVFNMQFEFFIPMIEKIMTHKVNKKTGETNKEWSGFLNKMKECAEAIEENTDSLNSNLSRDYGAQALSNIMKLSEHKLNESISVDSVKGESIIFDGQTYDIVFDLQNKTLKILEITPKPSNVKGVMDKLRQLIKESLLLVIEPKNTLFLYPLEKEELVAKTGSVVKDVRGVEYVIQSVYRENKQDMVTLRRDMQVNSNDLSRSFTKGYDRIGAWKALEV